MLIEVDPALLHQVGTRLTEAVGVIEHVKNRRDGLKALLADCGSDELQRAAGQFLDEWAYGVDCLEEDARTLAQLLTSSGKVYIELDDDIAKHFGVR